MDDLISRQAAICSLDDEITITGKANAYVVKDYVQRVKRKLENLPSVQPEPHSISYADCANAMMMMWIEEVITDGEYNRIMDRLNERKTDGRFN